MFKLPNKFVTGFLVSQWSDLPVPQGDLSGQTVIVTGANTGLGFEAARHFVQLKASKVILACRSVDKGLKAKEDIERSTKTKGVVDVWQVDLKSFQSVKDFCKKAETLDRLDIVVENAGIAIGKREIVEGHESTITVNVISTFLMALLLLPTMRKSSKKTKIAPRLTIVASETHFMAELREKKATKIFEALSAEDNKYQPDKYNASKLLEVLFVRELASAMSASSKESDPPVILNCLNPGLCESELMRSVAFPLSFIIQVGKKILLARSTEEGSRTLVASALAGPESHGQYMSDCKVVEPSRFVQSEEGKVVQQRVYTELLEIAEKIEPGIKQNI